MTLQHFTNSLTAKDPRVINRKTDACDWYFGHPSKGEIEICHERTHWGMSKAQTLHPTPAQIFYGIFNDINSSYWTNVIYTDKELGEREATQYGGELEECHYCDENNKSYFMVFNNFDKMAGFMYDKLEVSES